MESGISGEERTADSKNPTTWTSIFISASYVKPYLSEIFTPHVTMFDDESLDSDGDVNGNSGVCFSYISTVKVHGRGLVSMDSLHIVDFVHAGNIEFSRVFSFIHATVTSKQNSSKSMLMG